MKQTYAFGTHKNTHKHLFSSILHYRGVNGLQEPVWGIAYNIAKEDVERVVAHLDHREKDGYQKTPVTFHPQDSSIQPWQLIIYLGKHTSSSLSMFSFSLEWLIMVNAV